jgi:hypothetical protein
MVLRGLLWGVGLLAPLGEACGCADDKHSIPPRGVVCGCADGARRGDCIGCALICGCGAADLGIESIGTCGI